MYYEGEGVQQDYEKAIYWLEKAADQRSVEAQSLLRMVREEYQKALGSK